MGNILGAPFSKFVTDQINRRQESQGKGSKGAALRDSKDILYQQSKTPWLRLASSVNISGESSSPKALKELKALGFTKQQVLGNRLAKNCVLQGGVTSYDKSIGKDQSDLLGNMLRAFKGEKAVEYTGSPEQRSGGNFGTNFEGAYGWGGASKRGLVPMPGITEAKLKYINNGALSKTEITIKCYSKTQLAILDMLYMRPGYTLLLEFGWSVYLDNNGDIQQYDDFNSSPLRYLFGGGTRINQYKLAKKIREERKKKFGNYEGVYGKVSNFSWSLDKDGSYTCTVTLTGLGDMLESLKMNVSLNKKIELESGEEPDEDESVPLIANATKTSLNQWLFSVYDSSYSWYDTPDIKFLDKEIKKFATPSSDYRRTKTIKIKNAQLVVDVNSTDDGDDADNASSPQVYITFGYLIAWIQHNLLLKGNDGTPTCAFDMDFESLHTDENFMLSPLGQFSPNPLICMIPFSQPKLDQDQLSTWEVVKDHIDFLEWFGSDIELPETTLNNQIKKKIGKSFQLDANNGRLSQVLLSINHLAKVLDNMPIDEDNTISLNDYLTQILADMQGALGGINEITMKLNDDGTLIQFIENAPNKFIRTPKAHLRDKDNNRLIPCEFVSYGFDGKGKGSIMKNIAINGSIPSNFSSLITIGAQVNGNQVAGNATTFSNYNEGLVDRIIPVRKNEEEVTDVPKDADAAKNQTQLIKDIINKMTYGGFWSGFVGGVGGVWEDVMDDLDFLSDDINTLSSLHSQYIQALTGLYTSISKQSGAPFFLPFELSLDIDGISGIYLHQKFQIDKKVLPPSYDSVAMEILVKGVDQEITPSSWTTKITTQSAPSNTPPKPVGFGNPEPSAFRGF